MLSEVVIILFLIWFNYLKSEATSTITLLSPLTQSKINSKTQ